MLTAFVLLFTTCTTVSDELTFPVEPSLELLSTSDTELTEFTEPLVLQLRYEDGDGDLGNADPDVNSIFVRDERLSEPDAYYLAPLAPDGARISITGELTVELNPTFRLGNAPTETTTFTLWITDRAGNESNRLTIGSVTIVPQ